MAREATAITDSPLTFGEFYDAVVANPEHAAYVIRVGADETFTFEDANEVLQAIAGRPLSEIRGRRIEECLPADIATCLTNNLRACVATARPVTYHRTTDLDDGARLSIKTSLSPVVRGSGPVRFVIGFTRDVTHETAMVESAQHHAAMLRTLGIALPSSVYMLDARARTISFIGRDVSAERQAWRKQAEDAGEEAIHRFLHPDDVPTAMKHWDTLADLRDGEVATVSYRILTLSGEYRRHLNREVVFSRDRDGRVKLVLGVSEDVSEQDRIEQEVRDLSARMLTLQIDERRRIAEELHDSTGQYLTAAVLALCSARSHREAEQLPAGRSDPLMSVLDDAAFSVGEAQREIRVLSYLLHPPLLRSKGLAEAVDVFATGFGRRAGLRVSTRIAPAADRIQDDAAVHLFRVCQEALTNVYRHANARKAHVQLEVDDDAIELTVKDDGIGFDETVADRLLGVGLPGMRERMARLGGSVSITSNPAGTTLIARLPASYALAGGPSPHPERRAAAGAEVSPG